MTERTILVVDDLFHRAMVCAWQATLRRQQPAAEDECGGDICSLPSATSTDDDQPLE
jgi:hypothetical protein